MMRALRRRRARSPKRYAVAGLAGCVQQRTARESGTTISVYHAAQAGLDDDDGCKWYTVCETHSTLVGHPTLALARDWSSKPTTWCDECGEKESATQVSGTGASSRSEVNDECCKR